ncbi:Calx-beta domain-containing protein, partial [Arenibacter palladensis]|uniref:Calx-beta domain-containing protein n=1 Tax=Arenibacter palladensis TaxID=237373 RepID=UPI002FD49943
MKEPVMKINALYKILSSCLVFGRLKFLVIVSTLLFFGFNGYGQTVTIEDISSAEGGGLLFTVTYNTPFDIGAFTVTTGYTNVTATGGALPLASPEDYNNTAQVLNFSGTAGETQQFTVATLDDAIVEGTETFTVSLTSSNLAVDDSDTATGTITDNDTASVTVGNVSSAEGGGLLFTVTLDNAVASGAF